MTAWLKQNWFKVGMLVLIGLFAIQYSISSRGNSANDFNLQIQCADEAAKYFANEGYGEIHGLSVEYKNHFNSKLGKCLILISNFDPGTGTTIINLYDALESKHYAAFFGNNILCYPTAIDIKECLGNHGAIWLDGNDGKSPDFSIDQSDIKDSQEKFMGYIQSFMSN